LTLKTTSQRSFVKDDTTQKFVELYDTTIEPKYELKEYGTTLEGKMQTQNVLQLTVSKKDLVKGLKLSVGATKDLSKDKKPQQTINVGAEFQHEKLFFKANGGVPIEDRPFPITGNLVFQPVDNIFLGVKYDFKYSTGEKGKFAMDLVEFKVAGSSGASKGYLTGTLDKKIGVFVNHSLNSDDTVGLKVAVELPKEDGKATKLGVDVAAAHRACKSTTVQGKLNITPTMGDEKKQTGIRFGLGFSHTLKGTATVATLAADVNVGHFLGYGGVPHSLGFELKLK